MKNGGREGRRERGGRERERDRERGRGGVGMLEWG